MSGSLTHSPADILRQLLVDQSLGSNPSSTNHDWQVFSSQEPDSPDETITVYDVAGTIDGHEHAEGEAFEYYGFQIRVRAGAHAGGYTKASTIATTLDPLTLTNVTVSSSTYKIQSIIRSSPVLAIGKEKDGNRFLFTINGTIALTQTA